MYKSFKNSLDTLFDSEDIFFSTEFLKLLNSDVLDDTDENCERILDLISEFSSDVVEVYSTFPELYPAELSRGATKIIFSDNSCIDIFFEEGFIYLFNSFLLN